MVESIHSIDDDYASVGTNLPHLAPTLVINDYNADIIHSLEHAARWGQASGTHKRPNSAAANYKVPFSGMEHTEFFMPATVSRKKLYIMPYSWDIRTTTWFHAPSKESYE